MDREAYGRCRRALDEARDALDIVATTCSIPVAAAACRRALYLCCLVDRELNGTGAAAGDNAVEPAIEVFRARHSRLFDHESILRRATILAAVEWKDSAAVPGERDAEAEFERVFLPAARSIRLMLDEVAGELRNPDRWTWRAHGAVLALGAVLLASRWAWMMGSSEGLTVTFYHDKDFHKPVARLVAKQVSADYGTSRFQLSRHPFSARWEGALVVPVATNYEFYCQSEGGMRVLIDGDVVLDHWREVPWQDSGTHGNKQLSAGDHSLVVNYFKSRGHGAIRLRWAGGPIPDNTLLGVPYLRR